MKPSILENINDFTIGEAITIKITKFDSTLKDTLSIYVSNTLIKTIENISNEQTISFSNEEINSIYNALPTVTSATFKFENTTYEGENIIGEDTKTANGFISEEIKPTISKVEFEEEISGIKEKFGGYVQNRSKIKCTINATAGTGSQISNYSGNIDSYPINAQTTTISNLNINGNIDYKINLIDKRNRKTTATGTLNILAYEKPSISEFNVIRCNATGEEDLYGTYIKINANAKISDINSKNDKSFKIQYKLKSASEWTDLLVYNTSYAYTIVNSIYSNFSVDNAYDFRLTISDYFETIERKVNVPAGFSIIDIKGNGKGIALGKISTKNALEIGFDIYDKFDTKINNGLASYRTNNIDIDPNLTLEELILTSTNTPETGLWYIKTHFYENKTINSNRTQLALPYNQTATIYCRIFNNNTWGDWKDISTIISSDNHIGIYKAGKQLIQTGFALITPDNVSESTTTKITFKKTYKKVPVVMVTISNGTTNPQELSCTTNQITTSSVEIVLTRLSTKPTSIHYFVIGEVEQ